MQQWGQTLALYLDAGVTGFDKDEKCLQQE
jgi:hypothetical protein